MTKQEAGKREPLCVLFDAYAPLCLSEDLFSENQQIWIDIGCFHIFIELMVLYLFVA